METADNQSVMYRIKKTAMIPWKSLFDWDMGRIYAMLTVNVAGAVANLTDLFQLVIAMLTAYLLFLKIRKEKNPPPSKNEE
jgi:hypothetical protein